MARMIEANAEPDRAPRGGVARPRSREEPAVQRARIRSAALAVFSTSGYPKARMADIANKATISRTLLYHYYSNKEEILESLLVQAIDEVDELVERLSEAGGTVEAQVRAMVDGYHELMSGNPEVAPLCVELGAESHRSRAFEKRIAMLRESLLRWAHGLGPGVRDGVDREQFALLVTSVLIFWFVPTPFGRALGAGDSSPAALERHKEALSEMLVHAIAEPP
jgi:TetR/AcrR family transcriptional regulator, fatty acid metabolism regulator protein